MFKKRYIFFLIIIFAFIFLYSSKTIKNKDSIDNNKINIVSSKKENKKNILNENLNNEVNSLDKRQDSKILNFENIDQAIFEKGMLEKRLNDENAVEKLNSNTLTQEERNNYLEIYKKLSEIDSIIMKFKLKDISNSLSVLEKTHKEKLAKLGIIDQ